MTAAIGTLLFLVTLWTLVVAGAAMIEKSGARILAALKGHGASYTVATAPVRLRARGRLHPAMRIKPTLRAAA